MAKRYKGRKAHRTIKESIKEWIRAGLIGLLIIVLIRFFFVDLISLTNSSMEKTLLSGDVLIVNKLSYGARAPLRILPSSWLSVFSRNDSLVPATQLPYWRFPSTGRISQDDLVLLNVPSQHHLSVDRRHIIPGRIVALPGDTIEMKNSIVYLNGQKLSNPPMMQRNYRVETRGSVIDNNLLSQLQINDGGKVRGRNQYIFPLTMMQVDSLKKKKGIRNVIPSRSCGYVHFAPFGPATQIWTADNFGPVQIPYKGMSMELNNENMAKFFYTLVYHERVRITIFNDSVFINDKHAIDYTFRMNYYFALGDNRHDTYDSRNWGLLPEHHIKGKITRVFVSFDKAAPFFRKIRWTRLFNRVM